MSFIPRPLPNKDAVNIEGLTWVEWVAASGKAIFDRYGVYPWADRYNRELRKAWRSGIDPTEYRRT